MEKTFHNIPPVYDKNSKILILGSFPSVKSRETEFFYGHPQNRFWKVLAAVFECDIPVTIEEKKKMLLDNHIALWDVIASCEITGSSDSSIKNVVPNNINELLKHCDINMIIVNGKTAEKYYIRYIYPVTCIKPVCLPSTSPANAAYNCDKLVKIWHNILK